ncbi:MAG: hypothetical protein R3C05_27015 [Pirellulaceae bacterium]
MNSSIRIVRTISLWTVVPLVLLCLSGCESNVANSGGSPAPVENAYLLDAAPAEAISVSDAKANLATPGPVTVIGRINAGDHDPFEAGKAMFLMKSDATTIADPDRAAAAEEQHGGPGHDADNCPFCKRKNNPTDSVAIVRFLDEGGKPFEKDAREMLGVAKDQVVIVQGIADVDPLGHLVVDAKGLYIVR